MDAIIGIIQNFFISVFANYFTAPNTGTVTNNRSLSEEFKNAYNEAVDIYNESHPSSKIDLYLGSEPIADINLFKEQLKNEDLIQIIDKILRNKPIGYLHLLESQLIRIESGLKSSKLVNKDERLIYKNYPCGFYEIYDGANISIDSLYIEPPYKRVIFDGDNVEPQNGDKDFITHCEYLLDSQQILYLYGPYGYGKTFLTKKLLSTISEKNKGYTIYISSRHLPVSSDAYSSVFSYDAIDFLINKYGRLYIFIDSFEDILFAIEKSHSTLNYYEALKDLCERYPSLYFIINERIPDGIQFEDAFLPFVDLKKVKEIIKLECFSNSDIAEWIDNYTFFKKNNSLSYEAIKKANKNLRSSLKNPLLLLMMALSDSPISSTQSWFLLFRTFIEKTIQGKYEQERYRNFFLESGGKDIYKAYKEFINDVAYKILKTSKPKYNIEKFQLPDYYLDPNDSNFIIENKRIEKIISNRFKKFVPESKENELFKYLNCYFFECSRINDKEQYWKFKDNNILFFLFASGFCSLFEEALKQYSSPNNKNKLPNLVLPLRNHIKKVPLHPVVIEFILDRIEHSNCSVDYVGFIQDLIRNEVIINIPTTKTLSLRYEKIKTDVLFSIIYIRFNKTYTIENRHCFKRLAQYFSFIKHIDKNIASIIQRYYRKITVIDAEFRGINLKGYNLSFSTLKQVSFIRCKMEKTLFLGNYLNDVFFNLCYFNDMNFGKIIGKFSFRSCELLHTSIDIDNNYDNRLNPYKELEFKNCIIDQVFISSKLRRVAIKITNCDIKQLQINCKDVDLSIEGSVLSKKIALKNSNIHYSEDVKYNTINGYLADSVLGLFNIDQGSNLSEIIKKEIEEMVEKETLDEMNQERSLSDQDVRTRLRVNIKNNVEKLSQIQHELGLNSSTKSMLYAQEIECLKVPLFYNWFKCGFGIFEDLSSDGIDKTTYNMFIIKPISFLKKRMDFLDKNPLPFIEKDLKDALYQLYKNEIKLRESRRY